MRKFYLFLLIASAVFVGILYVAPLLAIKGHLQERGEPFVLSLGASQGELFYLGRAREIYDGHYPPVDLHFDKQETTILNAIPSLVLASSMFFSGGNTTTAYLMVLSIFPGISLLLFYYLGKKYLFYSSAWALFFAFVAVLTPIAFRILNFNGA